MECAQHPRYEARRRPSSDCKACHRIWKTSQYNPEAAFKKAIHKRLLSLKREEG